MVVGIRLWCPPAIVRLVFERQATPTVLDPVEEKPISFPFILVCSVVAVCTFLGQYIFFSSSYLSSSPWICSSNWNHLPRRHRDKPQSSFTIMSLLLYHCSFSLFRSLARSFWYWNTHLLTVVCVQFIVLPSQDFRCDNHYVDCELITVALTSVHPNQMDF